MRYQRFLKYKANQGDGYVSWLPAHVFGQLVDNHAWILEALHMRVVDNPLHAANIAKKFSLIFSLEFQEFMKKFILI